MMLRFRSYVALITLAFACVTSGAQTHRVQLLCHRTANRDAPENTLESLALAVRMGCDEVEIDIRRTLDGVLVLNHDGFLERFTDTTGEIETTALPELEKLDFGAYYGARFAGMRLTQFDEALRFARDHNILLHLDLKTDDLALQVMAEVEREHAAQHVIYGGEWQNRLPLSVDAPRETSAYLQPGMTAQEVAELHAKGKKVVGGFSANGHETDLAGMQAAVAAGVDGLWVDYPRLGAEAAGRSVEATVAKLIASAESGQATERRAAIQELSFFYGFPLLNHFLQWMGDGDAVVSHAAAVALVTSRPTATVAQVAPLLRAQSPHARESAAWAVGRLAQAAGDASCTGLLFPLLDDGDTATVQQALLSLGWCPVSSTTPVPTEKLLKLLHGNVAMTRGLAAVALARHAPRVAAEHVPLQLAKEEAVAALDYAELAKRGHPKLTQAEIDRTVELYRSQMKFMEALAMLPRQSALDALSTQAFRRVSDYSQMTGLVAGYQLWDRLPDNPAPALKALSESDSVAADRAEWALVEAGPRVLPAVRAAVATASPAMRSRLLQILAWQADAEALPMLHGLLKTSSAQAEVRWAIAKIEALHPELP